jgi:hypothetical protein
MNSVNSMEDRDKKVTAPSGAQPDNHQARRSDTGYSITTGTRCASAHINS